MGKKKFKIDWKSKFIDLLLVIVGISLAFKLNTWNESNKANREIQEYILSFNEESLDNKATLNNALEYSLSIKKDLDSLKLILLAKEYDNPDIKDYTASLMGLSNFIPVTATMENITASGEFGLIKDAELKKGLIDTYSSYKSTIKVDGLLLEYVDKYLIPYFFENIRFSDFSEIKGDFFKNPKFENIVFGYDVLLNQQIKSYSGALEEINNLIITIDANKK